MLERSNPAEACSWREIRTTEAGPSAAQGPVGRAGQRVWREPWVLANNSSGAAGPGTF